MGTVHPCQQTANDESSGAQTSHRGAVAVIGAGVIGLTSALQLQQQGFSVTLYDAQGVAGGASFGNAGHIATEQVFPLASTGLLWQLPKLLRQGTLALRWRAIWSERRFFWHFLKSMRPAAWRRSHQVLRHLCQQAMPAWQRLLSAHQLTELFVPRGNLLVFEGAAAETNALSQQQTYAAAGVVCQVLTQAQTRALCPGLASSVRCSLWFEQTGHCVSPGTLCQKLAQVFCQAGGTLLLEQVVSVQPTSQQQVLVHLASGTASQFQQVVLCTGAASHPLLRPLGIRLPLTAERGYHVHTPLAQMPSMAVASFDRKMILTPMHDGLRACGLVEFAGVGAHPNWHHLTGLGAHAKALWPALAAQESTTSWSGERPTIADSLPVVGESGIAGVWLNLGHQHLGLTFAAYSAELLLSAMTGAADSSVNILAALSRQRFV